MEVLISGSRTIDDPEVIAKAIDDSGFEITGILSGGAKGVDALAEAWAEQHDIPVTRIVPDWKRHGRGAGFQANKKLLARADAVIAIWDGKSKGTKDVIDKAEKKGMSVKVMFA